MFDLPLGAFHSSFCPGEEYKGDTEVQENFLSFDADLVAEQLTYMDAVSRDKGQKKRKFWRCGLQMLLFCNTGSKNTWGNGQFLYRST